MGPMGGFTLASFSTSQYLDFNRIPADQIPDLTQNDPRWIGAWWLGFPVCSLLIVVFAIPMFFYPKVMTRKSIKKDVEETKDSTEPLMSNGQGSTECAPEKGVRKVMQIKEGLQGALISIFNIVDTIVPQIAPQILKRIVLQIHQYLSYKCTNSIWMNCARSGLQIFCTAYKITGAEAAQYALGS